MGAELASILDQPSPLKSEKSPIVPTHTHVYPVLGLPPSIGSSALVDAYSTKKQDNDIGVGAEEWS